MRTFSSGAKGRQVRTCWCRVARCRGRSGCAWGERGAGEEERSWQELGRLWGREDLQPSCKVGLCPRESGELLEVLSGGVTPLPHATDSDRHVGRARGRGLALAGWRQRAWGTWFRV